jgi:CMP-N-acetylneuraminic acid synthetase
MKILITICARGGSKDIPEKNIKILNGRPLIDYTIHSARQFQQKFEDVDVVLSTDSLKIKKVAENCGLISDYIRPEILAGDKVSKIEAIRDVLLWQENIMSYKYDYILDLDVSSPLRNLNDLTNGFEYLMKNDDAINLFSVSSANRNPYFNMVEQNKDGFFDLVKSLESSISSRQSAPKVYDLNASFYFYKRIFFDLKYDRVITEKSMIYEIPHICFDIDHHIDFEIISYLMENNKLDFEL